MENIIFPGNYNQSRDLLKKLVQDFKNEGLSCDLKSVRITETHHTDIVTVRPSDGKNNGSVLLISTGLHGIEGYMGNVFLQLITDYYLKKRLHSKFGLILIHAVNPWGMDNFRRVNENNVDLNRNFIANWNSHSKGVNSEYRDVEDLLNPKRAIRSSDVELLPFLLKNIGKIRRYGTGMIKKALTLGQYEFGNGVYFGGSEYQKSSMLMINMFKTILDGYDNMMHFDIHTGAGPKNRMSVINSASEKTGDDFLKRETGYDLIYRSDDNDFYRICGDINDYFYVLKELKHEGKSGFFYSTCFEFGTHGESVLGYLKTMKGIVNENGGFFHGYSSANAEKKSKADFLSMFYPSDSTWREAAVSDAKKAVESFTEYFIKSCRFS